ncbi:MAG: hypothetical protein KGR68_17695 [Betaproteobacteria bacterium]|nr:hypothetical protein [Betaproteobacteria bacterium]
MNFLITLLCAGSLAYQMACGQDSPVVAAITGLAWLMVLAQAMEDRT